MDDALTRAQVRLRNLGTVGRDPDSNQLTLLFYGGLFSQWCSTTFVVDGVSYCTAEQYMMAQKARLFNDAEMLDRIMSTRNPADQKAYGKLVEGFDKQVWESVARDVVRTGSMAKFRDPGRRTELLSTRGVCLVEASETDNIWGIGRSEQDPQAMRRKQWRGTNWLGECLMDVRYLLAGE